MQVKRDTRLGMLDTLKTDIEASFVGGIGYVEFLNTLGASICSLAFDEMENPSTSSDNAILRFKSIDGSYVLKGSSTGDGPVTSFRILAGTGDPYAITGTVGSLASSSDLRFNIVQWESGTYVTIENFEIIIPNGS